MSWKAKFAAACQLSFSEQAKFWLNGFWQDGAEGYAEEIWELAHKFIECDLGEPVRYGSRMKQYKEVCDLDELKSHVVLEWLGNVLTVTELRKRLQKLDIDNNKRMALLEYLLDKYDKTPEALMAAPQPDIDPAVLQAAQDAFAAAGEALFLASSEKKAAQAAASLAAQSLAAAQAAAAEAARRLAQSKAASVEAAEALVMAEQAKQAAAEAHAKQVAAEAEVQAVVDEIIALERARSDKLAKLDAIINDSSIGQVKRARSANEKEQLLGEDELPLRKAKITQKAALKRVAVATAAAANVLHRADAAKAVSAKAKSAADQAEAVSKEAKAAADRAEAASAKAKAEADRTAVDAAKAHEAAVVAEKEAEAKLEEIKNSSGPPWGPIFWMERTLKEKKKFMK